MFWIRKWDASWTIFFWELPNTNLSRNAMLHNISSDHLLRNFTQALYLCSGTAQRISFECGHPRIVYLEASTWSIEVNDSIIVHRNDANLSRNPDWRMHSDKWICKQVERGGGQNDRQVRAQIKYSCWRVRVKVGDRDRVRCKRPAPFGLELFVLFVFIRFVRYWETDLFFN